MATAYATALADLVAQMKLFLPPETWEGREDLLTTAAAPLARAFVTAQEFADDGTIGGAEHQWLELLATNYGMKRAVAETDTNLRIRLRNVEEALTCAAIVAAVDTILVAYTGTGSICIEHFQQGPVCDAETPLISGICDVSFLYGVIPAFTLLVPDLGNTHPAWGAIYAEVERLRAAGVVWFFVIDDQPYTYWP